MELKRKLTLLITSTAPCMNDSPQILSFMAYNRTFTFYYQPIGRDLDALEHRRRARQVAWRYAFTFETAEDLQLFFAQSPQAVHYGIRLLFTRFISDPDWRPTVTTVLLIGFSLPCISTFVWCPICQLPYGFWCDEGINTQSLQSPIPEST